MSAIHLVASGLAAALVMLGVQPACGQLQQDRPIRIVTSGFGGGTDFASRQLASGLSARLSQNVIVENRGSSVVPGEVVSKANPDGHTLLVSTGGVLWVLPMFLKVPYDPVRDFSPVVLAASFPTVLVINASLPVNSVKELIALAKAKPGALNHVMTAYGGSAHLAAELFKYMAGVKIASVPYKNTGTGIADLISGRVQLFFSASGPVMPHVKAGKLKALAVTSPRPFPLLPDLPIVAHTLPGYDIEGFYCVFAPAKTPASVLNQLNRELVQVLGQADVRQKFLAAGIEPRGGSSADLGALMKADMKKMANLVKNAGIKAQ
ncbi:MAG: tripartite tricarboxylate transporter substrate binding protein [Betaproteobacteria bacterium]|nr:tripartite tricarboxylate transporter substrate binding protein [Betaproteobacteria bacterium]